MITSEQAKAARKALGWTQEQLSAEARVAESIISAFERGKRRTSDHAIRAIYDALMAAGVRFSDGKATAASDHPLRVR
jgi:transcriptional regulator with XRE-family HTH domain